MSAYDRLIDSLRPLLKGRPDAGQVARMLERLAAAVRYSHESKDSPEARVAAWAAEHPDGRAAAVDIAVQSGIDAASMNPLTLGRLVARGLRMHSVRWSSDSHTIDGCSVRLWSGPDFILRRNGT